MADTSPQTGTALFVILGVAVALLVALIGFVWWAVAQRPEPVERPDTRRELWESAMRKAGVEATYPETPVRLTTLVATDGRHSLDATFSGPELAALMNSYPYPQTTPRGEAALTAVSIGFAPEGVAEIAANARVSGDVYRASMRGPVVWDRGRLYSPGATSARVAGFAVPRNRLREATAFVIDYANAYIRAAPGLEIESVTFEADGSVRVKGSVPARLE